MSYPWEKDVIEKYGQENCDQLVNQQKEYEESLKDNDCPKCGWKNEGRVVKSNDGVGLLIHFALWTNGVCNTCKQSVKQKNQTKE